MTDNSHNGSTKPLLLDNTIGISSNDVVVVAEGGGYGSVVVVHLDDDDDGWEALHHHHHHDTAATNSSSGGSVGQVIAGMTKNLIGCGALSLSNGLALFYTPKTSLALCIVVACLTIYGMAVIFGYYCWLIGSICATTKQSTYRAIWDTSLQRLRNSNTTSNDCSNGSSTTTTKATTAASSIPSSNDNGSAIFVAISNTLKASLATLAYSSILTDTVLKLLESLYGPSSSNHRTQCLLVITITTLLPLCLFRNIQFLAPCSIIGTLGIVMTTMIMLLRSIDGTYDANGGIYYRDLPPQYQPSFYTTTNTTDTNSTNEHQSSSSLWSSSSLAILPFVCMVYEVRLGRWKKISKCMQLLFLQCFVSSN